MITTRIDLFKLKYTALVRYFVKKSFRFPTHLDDEIVNLLEYLDSMEIKEDTFLLANFRGYKMDADEKYKYPYITYLLRNPMCLGIYQRYHKVHGDDMGIINYIPSVIAINKMHEDCYFWFNVKLDERYKQDKILPQMSIIFNYYYITTFKHLIKKNNLGMYVLNRSAFEEKTGVPYKTLERIYNKALGEYSGE